MIDSLEDRVDHLHSAVKHNTPYFNSMGFQYVGFDPNNPIARFSDKSDPLPMVIEYQINSYGQHLFRITIRTFGMGIQMNTPWVTSGKDTFEPRLKRMKFYADMLRHAQKEESGQIPQHIEVIGYTTELAIDWMRANHDTDYGNLTVSAKNKWQAEGIPVHIIKQPLNSTP